MLELICNGEVHYRRSIDHPDIKMWLNQMDCGKASGYSIRGQSQNSEGSGTQPTIDNTGSKQALSEIAANLTTLLYRYGGNMPIDAFRELQKIERQLLAA